MNLKNILNILPVLPNRQDATVDQLKELEIIARHLGMLDAADAIRTLFETERLSNIRMGCHCDVESMGDDFEPDGCVIDDGNLEGCVYARPGMRKEECEYWRPYHKTETAKSCGLGYMIKRARELASLRNKSTPGPWRVDDKRYETHGSRVVGDGWVVARCDTRTDGIASYDAELIAAAPEMAELLGKIANHIERQLSSLEAE